MRCLGAPVGAAVRSHDVGAVRSGSVGYPEGPSLRSLFVPWARRPVLPSIHLGDHWAFVAPRNGTPVARRGRKATGPPGSAGPPKGSVIDVLGWRALDR